MPDFQIVSDDLRVPESGSRGRGRKSDVTLALLDGKTVMLPKGSKVGNSATFRRAGFRLRSHQRPEGVVVWVEKIEEPDGQS